jgi:hypothetical protein
MNANDVELVRVYPRIKGGKISDVAFPYGTDFEVVVEGESGASMYGTGAQWEIRICVRDLTASNPIIHSDTLKGFFGDRNWTQQEYHAVFKIPPPTSKHEDHVWEVLATLKVGAIHPDVSFAESPKFVIIAP